MIIAFGSALALSMPLAAQEGPPIGGLTGTIALDRTVAQEYAVAKIVIRKTLDGVRHVFHFSKAAPGHGDTGTGYTRYLTDGYARSHQPRGSGLQDRLNPSE
jgi:hypothetical protein